MGEAMYWWIGLIGSIASIGAAVWTVVQARRARNAASDAENFRDEIIEKRRLVEVSQLYKETGRILTAVTAVGPTCGQKSLRGIDCSKIAGDVLEYTRFLGHQAVDLPSPFKEKVGAFLVNIKPDIESLSEAVTYQEIKASGKSIYYRIDGLMPEIKKLVDEKRENRK